MDRRIVEHTFRIPTRQHISFTILQFEILEHAYCIHTVAFLTEHFVSFLFATGLGELNHEQLWHGYDFDFGGMRPAAMAGCDDLNDCWALMMERVDSLQHQTDFFVLRLL